MKLNQLACRRGVASLVGLLFVCAAHAQSPANPFDYSRTSSFTYRANGMLEVERIEPDNAASCVQTTHTYDDYGNKTATVTANCGLAGTPPEALFAERRNEVLYQPVANQVLRLGNGGTANVSVPAGQFATQQTNALGHQEVRRYDPRFGVPVEITGPNGLTTRFELDEFGRQVKEIRADGTSVVTMYCLLPQQATGYGGWGSPVLPAGPTPQQVYTSNGSSPDCPAETGDRVRVSLIYTEPRDAAGVKMGPATRVYLDRLGRQRETVTEAFDGPSQVGGTQRSVVSAQEYNIFGAAVLKRGAKFAGDTSTAEGITMTQYDVLGRPTQIDVTDPDGNVDNVYFGQLELMGPYNFGPLPMRKSARSVVTYEGLKTTTTNAKGQVRIEEKNLDGAVVRITDATGAQLVHQHDAFGNLLSTKDALQNVVAMGYDLRGRRIEMNDPDKGLWQYRYNALGELGWQQGPNQRTAGTATTMAYDLLGRMTTRTEPEYISTWRYDTYADGTNCFKGSLCEVSTSHGTHRKFVYDGYGRATSSRSTVSNGPTLTTAMSYDANTGRPLLQTYPTGLQVRHEYTPKGYMHRLRLVTPATVTPRPATPGGASGAPVSLAANTLLWELLTVNASGQVEEKLLGNGVTEKRRFNPETGRIETATAGLGAATNVLNHTYAWDSLNNLSARADANGDGNTGAVSESFIYDGLNRLSEYTVAAPALPNLTRTVQVRYNAIGNILSKSDVGSYAYGNTGPSGPSRPHAVRQVWGAHNATYTYDANGNLTEAVGGKYRALAYTSFDMPLTASGAGGSTTYAWHYDADHQRIRETRTNSSGTRTTWYLHPDNAGGLGFESETQGAVTSNRHYLNAGGGTFAVLVTQGDLPAIGASQTTPPVVATLAVVKLEYWHKDHLGSLSSTTDHTGAVTARYAYDPYGKRRFTNGSYDEMGSLVVDWADGLNHGTDRGFTGHEHLDDIGIIHMNGRIYDPLIARFMQADPMVTDLSNLQDYNRYSYCAGNPLNCTDPTGYWSLRRYIKNVVKFMFVPTMRNAVNMISSAPGQGAVDKLLLRNKFLYQVGMIVVSIYGGPAATAAYTTYYTALRTGSMNAAFKAGAISLASSAMFYQAGEVGLGREYGLAHFAAHAVAGCVSSEMSCGKCGQGALAAVVTLGMTPMIGAATKQNPILGAMAASVAGGVGSVIGGGKFSEGAKTGAFSYLFNALEHGFGYEYPADVEHPFGPTSEFKERFFGSQEERQVWFRTQEIATGQADVREWLRFNDPKIQLPRSGGPLYAIYDLGLDTAGAVRIAWSPKIPNVFYVSLDHYQATPAQPLRWTRFEAAPPKK